MKVFSRSRTPLAIGAVLTLAAGEAIAADALVYRENPVRTPVPELTPLSVAPEGDALEGAGVRVRSCADRGRSAVVATVSTSPIRACSLEASARPNPDGDYIASPRERPDAAGAPDPFAEASAYHHVTRALAYFDALVGAPASRRASIDVVVGGRLSGAFLGGDDRLVPVPNALYLPASDAAGAPFRGYVGAERDLLWIGASAGFDLAYDGDVLVHEAVHAALDTGDRIRGYRRTEDGLSRDPEAIAEGLADYFTAVITGHPTLGDAAFSGEDEAPRDLEAPPLALARVTGDPHASGVVFAGALWRARAALPASDARRFDARIVALVRDASTPSDSGMADLGRRLVEGLRGDAVDVSPLEAELRARGIFPPSSTVVEVQADVALRSPTGAFLAPGTRAAAEAGWVGASIAPGMFRARLALVPGATALRGSVVPRAASRAAWGAVPGTPMALVAIVSWDEPLGAISRIEAPIDGSVFEVPVPGGAREAYVQIGNAGEADGAFDALMLTLLTDAPPNAIAYEIGGGCALARPRGSTAGALGLAPIALLARFIRRRERTSRRSGSSPPSPRLRGS